MNELHVTNRCECTVIEDEYRLTIGQDMRMDGVDSPAFLTCRAEVELLIKILQAKLDAGWKGHRDARQSTD